MNKQDKFNYVKLFTSFSFELRFNRKRHESRMMREQLRCFLFNLCSFVHNFNEEIIWAHLKDLKIETDSWANYRDKVHNCLAFLTATSSLCAVYGWLSKIKLCLFQCSSDGPVHTSIYLIQVAFGLPCIHRPLHW